MDLNNLIFNTNKAKRMTDEQLEKTIKSGYELLSVLSNLLKNLEIERERRCNKL